MEMKSSIEVQGVTMRFGGVTALREVNLSLEGQKIVGLLGRNGAGKTTLLSLMTNRLFPSEGQVLLDGENVRENDAALSKIFYMGEKNPYLDTTTVAQLFRYTASFYPGFHADKAAALAERFELDVKKKLKNLSTGYLTIAKLVTALATDVPYLLFDEPVLGLDANHRELFYRMLVEDYSERPRTIVLSTHLIEEIADIIEQVVILKEAQQLRGLDKLSLYTQKPSPTTILVICHKEKNADRRSAFYKGCAANGAVLESVRPRDYEIASWLQRFIAGKGLAIDTKALSMLTDHLGTDISKISNELGKLVVSLPEGTKRITDADIEANIGISKDYNNFELCKAVATRDMARALTIAEHFARNPKDNPLLVTVLALFGQFKELFVVNYLRWLSRHKGVAFPPDTELMRILKKSNVYVIGEIKQNAVNWDNRKVFNILGLLREYDAKSKGMNAGGASDGELLRELLLKIFML